MKENSYRSLNRMTDDVSGRNISVILQQVMKPVIVFSLKQLTNSRPYITFGYTLIMRVHFTSMCLWAPRYTHSAPLLLLIKEEKSRNVFTFLSICIFTYVKNMRMNVYVCTATSYKNRNIFSF